MLDHVGLQTSDLTRAKAFYLAALAPLGYSLFREFDDGAGRRGAGFGGGGIPDLWLYAVTGRSTAAGLHLAFSAPNRTTVDAFYRAALAAGGADNGAPGLRQHYHPNYYGAFVLDPDGHNIEAVCHREA